MPTLCPAWGGKGILALLLLTDDIRYKEKNKVNHILSMCVSLSVSHNISRLRKNKTVKIPPKPQLSSMVEKGDEVVLASG